MFELGFPMKSMNCQKVLFEASHKGDQVLERSPNSGSPRKSSEGQKANMLFPSFSLVFW